MKKCCLALPSSSSALSSILFLLLLRNFLTSSSKSDSLSGTILSDLSFAKLEECEDMINFNALNLGQLKDLVSLFPKRIFKAIILCCLIMNVVLIASFTILVVLLSYYIIEPSLAVAQSGSKSIQQQQNYSFIAKLTGNNTIPPVNTNATGIAKFYADAAKYNNNEVYYEINITNIHNDVVRVDVHIGKKTENGPTVTTLYQRTVSLPSEICCRSAASESEHSKFFFNGTISTQSLDFGPLAGSKNIADLVRLFGSGNAYVEVYTYNPESLSLLNSDSEIRGQIMPLASKSTR